LKEETLVCTLWKTPFGTCCRTVARQSHDDDDDDDDDDFVWILQTINFHTKEDKGDVRLPLTQKLGKIKFFCDITPPDVVDIYFAFILKKEVMNFYKTFLHVYQITQNYTLRVP